MNADEKAVAEWFKCDCGYDEASATCFDSGHDLGCKSRHSYVATALAARIRAEAERETAAALARAERAEARMDALRGWLVDHECKNDRCSFCRVLGRIDATASKEKV